MAGWRNADPHVVETNAVTLQELVSTLQHTPNLLMWIAGHRHFNTVKAFPSSRHRCSGKRFLAGGKLVTGFSAAPQNLEIYLNSDYTISIAVTNVDPSVGEGTPAAIF